MQKNSGKSRAAVALLCAAFILPVHALGASIAFATAPLANATTTDVLPNLMFIMDSSGSMDSGYLPDWVSGNLCKATDGDYDRACADQPPFRSPDFNSQYYNPRISYTPAVNGDGTSKTSQTTWTSVKNDAYGIQDNGSTNLVSEYTDDEWCTNSRYEDCLRNDNYILPGVVNGKRYDTLRSNVAAKGSGLVATGSPASATTKTRLFGPHYYTIIPGEYCDSAKLNNCKVQNAADSLYKFPAKLRWCNSKTNATAVTPAVGSCQALNTGSFVVARYPTKFTSSGGFIRTDIVPDTATYPKSAARIDCKTSATSCSYAEEMTNFANWWTYYRTRMQTMKTVASLAFKPIDNRYRIGFIDIYGKNYQPIARFESGTNGVKENWYRTLFAMNPSGGTPLRSALSRVGQIYAGKKPVGDADPVQYSCQQNFALLTTDGYWNTDKENDVMGLDNKPIGNMDGGNTKPPMKEGTAATYNTLADVAKYYYDTDLRNKTMWNNCTGGLNLDVCLDNVFVSGDDNNTRQHMTTFTLGLGVDGTLTYTSDYKTAQSGDFYNLTNGTGSPVVRWPTPVADDETAVDDLWHAAVNGGGTYFSAKDPAQLSSGLNGALASIKSTLGAGTAAATSSLNPVPGGNFAYVASYTTVKWQGNLEARSINLNDGNVSETASWCVENIVAGSCSAPGTIVTETNGSSTTASCVTETQGATQATCESGTLNGTTCSTKVEMPVACRGTLGARATGTSDTRKILMADKKNPGVKGLVDFTYANMNTTQQNYFSGTSLSQWSLLDSTQRTKVAGVNLVNFLRGQTGYEERSTNNIDTGNGIIDNRLYRYREATLGDATESQPAFIGKPTYSYTDLGYSEFIATNSSRKKTVYLGTNDGMLHAFDADNGVERWAYVPGMVIPNMWKLADKNYSSMHTNYVNGSPVIGDVYDSAKAAITGNPKDGWRTILVGGLNAGGRGFYALDITKPDEPVLLWEIDASMEPNLGYSYGHPVITKMQNGIWVVLLTSGYNNVDPGDGMGHLFVRDALTGARLHTTSTTADGLAKISTWADNPEKNNIAGYTYGGDLLGNIWRFDINSATVIKFAILKDGLGKPQPVTTKPELAQVNGKRIVYLGTGKYLEKSDLVDTQPQSLYAIKDDDSSVTLNNPRITLAKQAISSLGAGRTIDLKNSVTGDLKVGRGWYVDFPDSGERVSADIKLDTGVIIFPTTVPSNSICSPGGYGWLNYLDYSTGRVAIGSGKYLTSQKFNAPIVGVNIFRLPSGKRITAVVTAEHPTPEQPPEVLGGESPATGFVGKRIIWRELIQ